MNLYMQKKSLTLPVIVFILLMLFLTGCGSNYGKLPKEGKETVDFLYDNKSVWESTDCDSVSFQYRNGEKVFCVKELDRHYSSPSMNQYSFNYYYYTFDGSITKIDSDWKSGVYYNFGSSERYTYSPVWNANSTANEQKEYLAEEYLNAFNR